MTADQVKGKGFKGALSYNLIKVEKNVATVLASTFSKEDDKNAILKEVSLVRMQRPNLAKYFYHTSLNFPLNEDLPDEQMKAIAADYLHGMGLATSSTSSSGTLMQTTRTCISWSTVSAMMAA